MFLVHVLLIRTSNSGHGWSSNQFKKTTLQVRYKAVQSHETIFTIFTYWISNAKPHKKDNDRLFCGLLKTITGNPIIICRYLHCQNPLKYKQTIKQLRFVTVQDKKFIVLKWWFFSLGSYKCFHKNTQTELL